LTTNTCEWKGRTPRRLSKSSNPCWFPNLLFIIGIPTCFMPWLQKPAWQTPLTQAATVQS
jgi:hypothetical protein